MLIDSHCHLPTDITKAQTLLERAAQENVQKVITIGTSLAENQNALTLAQNLPNVYATIGIYPHENQDIPLDTLETQLTNALAQDTTQKIVGIGECGIDITNWQNQRTLDSQLQLFDMQILLAKKRSLPLVVHNRNGDEHVLRLLTHHADSTLTGVVHCFDGSWDFAQKVLALGFKISFSGFVTYTNKSYLLETVKKIPDDMYLLETDSPYILPKKLATGQKNQQNEPKNVRMIAQIVAATKNLPFEKVAQDSCENTLNLFKNMRLTA